MFLFHLVLILVIGSPLLFRHVRSKIRRAALVGVCRTQAIIVLHAQVLGRRDQALQVEGDG